jgi:uncharacterized membrane protein YqjE
MDQDSSTERRTIRLRRFWRRLGTPVKIGLAFAVIAGLMALVGWIVRPEYTSRSMLSLFLAVFISAGTWGLVSWAIAAAAVEATREEE